MRGPARLHGNFVANGESALHHAAHIPLVSRASPRSLPHSGRPAGAALRPRQRRPRRTTFGLTTLTTALIGAIAFAVLTHLGANARQARPVIEEADRLAELAGFGVQQVFLAGHRMTSDRDIFDALDLTHSRSLLRFDGNAARERIEDLPWIKTAAITRIFPDSINIEVTEREPMAVWHNAGRDMLIDATGRVLGAAPPSMQTGLPRVLGEEAAGAAAALLTTLDRYSSVRDRVREAVFVAKRRWTLQLKDGPALLLPADRMAEALDLVAAKLAPVRLLDDSRYAAIDLRSPDRIILTPRPEEEQKTASGHQLQPSG